MVYHTPVDEMAYYLKLMLDSRNSSSSDFLPSEDVYCVNPRMLFQIRKPLTNENVRYMRVNLNENSGKTDGCEDGCWRIIGHDKLIKLDGKILGFKKVYKFCDKDSRLVNWLKTCVMEEYRLVSKWKQHSVVCKIQLLGPKQLQSLLSNHIRGY